MTQPVLQRGLIVMRDGKVGTEQGCCCVCYKCVRNGEFDCSYTTQAACEECTAVHTCYTIVGDQIVTSTVASCEDCTGFSCVTDYVGPCGSWEPDPECLGLGLVCCDSCLSTCSPTLNVTEDTANYLKQSFIQDPNEALAGPPPYVDGWLASIGSCALVWVTDTVSQKNPTGKACGTFNGATQYALRSWIRYRLFLVDCRTLTLVDVTGEALTEEYGYTTCQVPSDGNGQPLCDPPFCNDGQNPGFLPDSPTLSCP